MYLWHYNKPQTTWLFTQQYTQTRAAFLLDLILPNVAQKIWKLTILAKRIKHFEFHHAHTHTHKKRQQENREVVSIFIYKILLKSFYKPTMNLHHWIQTRLKENLLWWIRWRRKNKYFMFYLFIFLNEFFRCGIVGSSTIMIWQEILICRYLCSSETKH